MKRALLVALLLVTAPAAHAAENPPVRQRIDNGAQFSLTPYNEQRVVFDFYFDHPQKIGPALQQVSTLLRTLTTSPYDYLPEFIDIKIVIHGTEIVTLAEKNYNDYRDVVERMRFLASLGVDFRVCGEAIADYQYSPSDLHDFVKVIPSAVAELAHWQLKGYAYLQPQVLIKKFATEDIR